MSDFGILTWVGNDYQGPIKKVVEFRRVPGQNGVNIQMIVNGERYGTKCMNNDRDRTVGILLLRYLGQDEYIPDIYESRDPLVCAINHLQGQRVTFERVWFWYS